MLEERLTDNLGVLKLVCEACDLEPRPVGLGAQLVERLARAVELHQRDEQRRKRDQQHHDDHSGQAA